MASYNPAQVLGIADCKGKIKEGFDADMSALPIKGSDFAPILKSVSASLDDDQMTELRRVLKAGSDALSDIETLKGLSTGGKVETTAEGKLDTLAKAKAEKDNISFAKAYTAVLTANPDLYAQYTTERGKSN